ncbi:MAG: hypothetical protein U5R49_16720 [Deltaproteobacteria bacterium]|nr:hypothetical protein [Deltaproteobacteria bacterium]
MPENEISPLQKWKNGWIDMAQVTNPNIEILEEALNHLGPLADEVVFLGGCATGLLLTDPAAPSPRVTIDVDVIVEVGSLAGYHQFSDRLKQRGFVEDAGPEAPICRWRAGQIILDVMPTDPNILGFGNIWFRRAFESAQLVKLPSGKALRLLPAAYFLATKLEAFDHRGGDDFLMSRDMEGVVTVVDGRPEIVEEVRNSETELKAYLKKRMLELIQSRDFIEALPGHLPPDAGSQARTQLILERLRG